jgi:apolipoprotein N-acyltransferase
VLTLIGFNWVSYTVYEFGHIPAPLALGVLIIFCSLAHLHIPLAALAWFWFCRKFNLKDWAKIALLPVFFSVSERFYPMIFQWHHGYTWLWGGFPAYHLADIIGFSGLSTMNFVFNALLLMALMGYRTGLPWRSWAAAGPVIFIAMNVFGHFHGRAWPAPDKQTSVLLVQANIGNQEKLAAEAGGAYRDVVVDKFFRRTQEGLAQEGVPQFIVWPETAFPEVIPEPTLGHGFAYKLRQAIAQFRTNLITGGYSIKEGTELYTNSFFVLNKEGNWADQPYHKSVLLAFGEYIPFGEIFPIFYKWLPYTGHFGRGPGPSVLTGDGVRIGAQICYEGLFDWFTRDLANKGAQVIVNVTNDSWYGIYQQPYEHLYMTLARAIEVRRPLVRSTNTGISGVILASGEILPLSPLEKEWHQLYQVPYLENAPATIFMSWGYWLLPALFAVTLLLAALRGRRA